MTEAPSDRPTRPQLFDFGDDSTPESEAPAHLRLWLGLALVLTAVIVAAVVTLSPRRSEQERAAVRAAVEKYSELYNEPAGRIYKYCIIESKPGGGGEWRVDIKRVIVPDAEGGYQITSKFNVDREGKAEYIGRIEGR